MNAFTKVFREETGKLDVQMTGCLFHFSQAIFRKQASIGLNPLYQDKESEVRRWIRRHMALAFIPPEAVADVWAEFLQDFPHWTNGVGLRTMSAEFLKYFHQQWILRTPIEQWNHCFNEGPRTSNMAEGFHNGLHNRLIPQNRPSLREFLRCLQRLHNVTLTRIAQLNDGDAPKPRNPTYIRIHQQLRKRVREFLQETQHAPRLTSTIVLPYLDSIANLLAGFEES
jgi:hypothetical protein